MPDKPYSPKGALSPWRLGMEIPCPDVRTMTCPWGIAVAINIMFDFNSDRITPQGRQILDNLGKALNSDRLKGNRFMLEGHTDSKGGDAYNLALSERRAKSAMDYLVAAHKIEPSRLQTVGKGKSEPLDPANPERDINRRVQVMNLGS